MLDMFYNMMYFMKDLIIAVALSIELVNQSHLSLKKFTLVD